MGAQPQPASQTPDPRALNSRLALRGVVITPATARPDTPIPEPLVIPGVSLSETVVQMRREADAA
jgi:hypothetical protein